MVAVVHESNEWNIECVEDEGPKQPVSSKTITTEGIRFAYEVPDTKDAEEEGEKEDEQSQPKKPLDLSQLRAKLKGL